MNHLQHESSPYLQQHAANPVDWYPWGEEALARARREERPILVSIGYSTCHWCHVMERESFEDRDIAGYMNANFINIKIDREERPDLDQVFMEACQAITGQGGWPLNVFLTPQGRPYYAGTYFPPEPQGRRLSWSQVLQYAAYNFFKNRQAVERQADRVQERIRRAERSAIEPVMVLTGTGVGFTGETINRIFGKLQEQFDRESGGFGPPPRFPNTMALEFLLHYGWHTGEEEAYHHLVLSLDRMLSGGIYDHLAGGLARYAVDGAWRVPHFEKMLYDNALLVQLLADVLRRKEGEAFREVLEQTLEFIGRELTSAEGGFFSALDADTGEEEGAYYTWSKGEIEAILGEEASIFCDFYGVTREGNWEGLNVLWRPFSLEAFAAQRNMDEPTLAKQLQRNRHRLLGVRSGRPFPHRDEKIILGWNALMVSALAKAFHATGREEYREGALRSMAFLSKNFLSFSSGLLPRIYQGGQVRQEAFLDDYAFLIEALLHAYALDFDPEKLEKALRLTEAVLDRFSDEEHLFFYFTGKASNDPFLRRRALRDDEMPSGNAVMASNLRRLGILFDRPEWRMRAGRMLAALREAMLDAPLPFARWATEAFAEAYGTPEIAVVGPEAFDLAWQIEARFIPGNVLMAAREADSNYTLLRHRNPQEGTLIYLCRDYACQQPVRTVDELFEQLFHLIGAR